MIPCKYCGAETRNEGTGQCNACYEVTSRLRAFLRSSGKARAYALSELSLAFDRASSGRSQHIECSADDRDDGRSVYMTGAIFRVGPS